MAAIAAEGPTRTFGRVTAVDDLTVEVPDSGVVGLVGPNGSGKSTLIRMLLGLIRPTSGTAQVLDLSIDHPAAYADRVGALIENPAFLPGLSARKNLQAIASLRGIDRARIAEVLDVVGLTGRENEPVRTFSLGMKQRLGIAAALLPDPHLLVLDEPTNGLDPAGIVEIRALLRRLADEGRTVIVSSHLLSEIEAACDHLVVIRFGRLMFNGPLSELMREASAHVDVEPEDAADADRLVVAFASAGWTVSRQGDGLRIEGGDVDGADVNRRALDEGVMLRTISPNKQTLEDVFLEMTGTDDGELARDRAAVATAKGGL